MLTARQKRLLRSMGQSEPAIIQVGKDGVGANLLQTVDAALAARELVKISVLNNCVEEVSSIAEQLTEGVPCELVQVIGRKILLYREAEEEPQQPQPRK